MQPVYYSQAMKVNSGTMTTASGQFLTTSVGNFPQQMISEAGKPTILVRQPGYIPVNSNHQAGAVTTTSQKENNPTCQNQFAALQPNSFYVSTLPAHSSSQVFNGSHIREVSSQPQILTSQTPGPMLNQPQLLYTMLNQSQSGYQSVNPLQPGLSWASSNQQHYQNPVIFYNPQTGMQMAVQLPLAAATQPVASTSVASAIVPPPVKNVYSKLKEKVINSSGPPGSMGTRFFASSPPITSLHGHVNQILPTTIAQQKFMGVYQTDSNKVQIVNDGTMFTRIETEPVALQTKFLSAKSKTAAVPYSRVHPMRSILPNIPITTVNAHMSQVLTSTETQQKFISVSQTDSNQIQIVNGETKSTEIETDPVSLQTKICFPQHSQTILVPYSENSQACVASTIDISAISTTPTSTIIESSGVSVSTANTQLTTVDAHVNEISSSPVELQKFAAIYQTNANPEQLVNDEKMSIEVEGKPVSIENKISSPQKSQPKVIVNQSIPITSTEDVSVIPIVSSPLNVESSTKSLKTKSSLHRNTFVASADTITSNFPSISSVDTSTPSIPTVSSVDTITSSIPTVSSVDTITSSIPTVLCVDTFTSSIPTVSSVDTVTLSGPTVSSVDTVTLSGPTVSSVDTITSSIPTVSSVDTITSSIPTVSSVDTFTSSISTVSSVDTITLSGPSISSVDPVTSYVETVLSIISNVPSVSPYLSWTDRESCDLNSKPSFPEAHNKDVFTSDQTNSTESIITTENLKPQQAIQQRTSNIVKSKKKAIVRPQVLTHVINGFIIEESSEPFPVSQSALLDSPCKVLSPDTRILPKGSEITATEKKTIALRPRGIVELAICAHCGHSGSHFRIKKKKRFCSKFCVKQFNQLNPDHAQITASSIQEHVGSGVHGRKRKRKRGRKRMQIGSLEEKENINTVNVGENSSTHANELSVSSKTEETNSRPETKSTVTCNTGEENSAPENESTVSCKTRGDNSAAEKESIIYYQTGVDDSVLENEPTMPCITPEDFSAPKNELIISYQTDADNSVPETEPAVSCIMAEDYSEPAASFPDQTPVEVDKLNVVPETEPAVSCIMAEDYSELAASFPDQTPVEVYNLNVELEKSKSDLLQKLPSKWTVQDVFEFIQNFPGCSDYADNFKSHEVDGQALFLLNHDHLTTSLCMKLGPALKLLSHIRIMEDNLKF